MKTINLFLKAHFTSLSPDGQFISLAIISESANFRTGIHPANFEQAEKSFYAEFGDFDINRCDDWVKENVVRKLTYLDFDCRMPKQSLLGSFDLSGKADSSIIKIWLGLWLKQFSDYKINFVVDCGWFCWGKFVELIGEWETTDYFETDDPNKIDDLLTKHGISVGSQEAIDCGYRFKIGLPKLPANFPPMPQDLNDLIALRRGISVSEAFELDRESLAYDKEKWNIDYAYMDKYSGSKTKFNALFDAKVTKAIYEKLI